MPFKEITEIYKKAIKPSAFFWALWMSLFAIVRKIPYNHPKQELLVVFVIKLSHKEMGTAMYYIYGG
jgi:hypothetical protein